MRKGQLFDGIFLWILIGTLLLILTATIIGIIYVKANNRDVIYINEPIPTPPTPVPNTTYTETPPEPEAPIIVYEPNASYTQQHVKVASWNLQIFGTTKASRPEVLQFYYDKLKVYDIIFVQEVRDSSDTAFKALCEKFVGYNCMISAREGRSSSKEQIGLIYNNTYNISNYVTLSDSNDTWERAPVTMEYGGYTFYNAHLKPEDVANELHALELVVNISRANILLMGDFNADCSYYDPAIGNNFLNWTWLINSDTTVAANNCSYDRIITNTASNIISYGVDSIGINTTYSDHYIVWVELNDIRR